MKEGALIKDELNRKRKDENNLARIQSINVSARTILEELPGFQYDYASAIDKYALVVKNLIKMTDKLRVAKLEYTQNYLSPAVGLKAQEGDKIVDVHPMYLPSLICVYQLCDDPIQKEARQKIIPDILEKLKVINDTLLSFLHQYQTIEKNDSSREAQQQQKHEIKEIQRYTDRGQQLVKALQESIMQGSEAASQKLRELKDDDEESARDIFRGDFDVLSLYDWYYEIQDMITPYQYNIPRIESTINVGTQEDNIQIKELTSEQIEELKKNNMYRALI